jgi:uncharacterized protein YraI
MTMKRFLLAAIAALLPLAASAQQAQSTKWVHLRAGPSADFPLVSTLGPGTPLSVQGCTEGYAWCDVIAPDQSRGWIYAGNIAYPYQGNAVPVIAYGPSIGFPIVVFSIGAYWGQYYRARPWYGNQAHWSYYRPPPPGYRPPGYRPPGYRPPPPAPGRPPGPPQGGRPPGGKPPGGPPPNIGRPPGGKPPGGPPPSTGRPPGGDRPPSGGRPPGGNPPPAGGRPSGGAPSAGSRPG